jgi:hypothetical protein
MRRVTRGWIDGDRRRRYDDRRDPIAPTRRIGRSIRARREVKSIYLLKRGYGEHSFGKDQSP